MAGYQVIMEAFGKTLIIIPTYNEASNVQKMVEKIFSVSPLLSVLIIDDNSPDHTADLVTNEQNQFSRLYLIKRDGKLGLGTAYLTGFQWGLEKGFEFLFEMDCDFSHDPDWIPRFLEAIQNQDLVIGSRYLDGVRVINWSIKRLLLSYLANVYTRFMTNMPLYDATGGYKCFRANALKQLDLTRIFSNGYMFQIEINYKLWKKGLRLKEIPIIFTERTDGHSKMNNSIVWEAVWGVLRLRLFNNL